MQFLSSATILAAAPNPTGEGIALLLALGLNQLLESGMRRGGGKKGGGRQEVVMVAGEADVMEEWNEAGRGGQREGGAGGEGVISGGWKALGIGGGSSAAGRGGGGKRRLTEKYYIEQNYKVVALSPSFFAISLRYT